VKGRNLWQKKNKARGMIIFEDKCLLQLFPLVMMNIIIVKLKP